MNIMGKKSLPVSGRKKSKNIRKEYIKIPEEHNR